MTSPVGEVAQRGLAVGSRAVAPDRDGGDAVRLKCRAMNRACSTLTQKPRQRIVAAFGVLDELLQTSRAQASELVYAVAERVDVVAASSPPRDVAQVEAVVDAEVRGTARGAAGRWRPTAAARRRCGRRTSAGSAARRCVPGSRSGRAARRASTWSRTRSYDCAGGVVELVDDHHVEVIRRQRCRGHSAFRLWIDAKTCSNRVGRAPPTHFSPNDGVAQRVAERGEALVEDLFAVGDEQQSRAREAAPRGPRSRARPSRSCRCRWPRRAGCGGAHARGTPRSARAVAPGTGAAQLDRAEDRRAVRRRPPPARLLLFVELRRRRTARSRRPAQ